MGDDGALVDNAAPAWRQSYNTDQMVVVPSPDGSHQIVISKPAEIDSDHYIDPISKEVVTFNHETLAVTEPRAFDGTEMVEALEPLRAVGQQVGLFPLLFAAPKQKLGITHARAR